MNFFKVWVKRLIFYAYAQMATVVHALMQRCTMVSSLWDYVFCLSCWTTSSSCNRTAFNIRNVDLSISAESPTNGNDKLYDNYLFYKWNWLAFSLSTRTLDDGPFEWTYNFFDLNSVPPVRNVITIKYLECISNIEVLIHVYFPFLPFSTSFSSLKSMDLFSW